MRLLDRVQRYILREFLSALSLVVGIFLIAIFLIDLVEQARTVGSDVELTPLMAVSLSLMKLPMLIEQTLALAILIAAIITFFNLNKRSELSIIRASGMSAWRFLWPVIFSTALIGIFATAVLNPIGAMLSENFEQRRAELLSGENQPRHRTGAIWRRDGNENRQLVIRANETNLEEATLVDVMIIEEERIFENGEPTNTFAFKRRIDAKRARLLSGFIQLESIVENIPNSPPIRREFLTLSTELDPDELLASSISSSTIGFWELLGLIERTRHAGLDPTQYELRWHRLLSAPLLFIAMALIGTIVCLRLARLGSVPQLIASGVVSAIIVISVTEISANLGASGNVQPWLAAWSPVLFACFFTFAVIAYREDG